MRHPPAAVADSRPTSPAGPGRRPCRAAGPTLRQPSGRPQLSRVSAASPCSPSATPEHDSAQSRHSPSLWSDTEPVPDRDKQRGCLQTYPRICHSHSARTSGRVTVLRSSRSPSISRSPSAGVPCAVKSGFRSIDTAGKSGARPRRAAAVSRAMSSAAASGHNASRAARLGAGPSGTSGSRRAGRLDSSSRTERARPRPEQAASRQELHRHPRELGACRRAENDRVEAPNHSFRSEDVVGQPRQPVEDVPNPAPTRVRRRCEWIVREPDADPETPIERHPDRNRAGADGQPCQHRPYDANGSRASHDRRARASPLYSPAARGCEDAGPRQRPQRRCARAGACGSSSARAGRRGH